MSARELSLGKTPPPPRKRDSIVIVPDLDREPAHPARPSAALSLGDTVVAVAVAGDEDEADRIKRDMGRMAVRGPDRGAARPATLADPHRGHYVKSDARTPTRRSPC